MVDADEYEDVGELKAMVLQLLEKRGVLAQLRAKVRASVFEAVTTSTTLAKEGELGAGKDDKPSRTTLNTRLSKSLDTQEGRVVCFVVRNRWEKVAHKNDLVMKSNCSTP